MTRVLRRLPARAGIMAGLALLGGLGLFGGRLVALGGFTGQIQQTTVATNAPTFQTGTQLLSDTVGSNSACLSSPNAAGNIFGNTAACSNYPLSTSAGGSQTVTLAAQGSVPVSGAAGLTTGGCGVQELADDAGAVADVSSAGTNTGVAEGGVTPGVAGPSTFSDSPSAASFDGSTGYIETNTSYTGPQTFSLALWFKASTPGVPLMGFGNTATLSPSSYDRMLWLDGSGHIIFGVYPGSTRTFSSGSTNSTNYADRSWHQVVVTVAPVTSTTGTVLIYVDGALVAGSSQDEVITSSQPAQAYTGYWHIGEAQTNSTGWHPGTNYPFFRGSLADVATFPTALSSSQVSALSGATTQVSERATILGDSPTSYWPLQQTQADPAVADGSVTYGAVGPTSTKAAMTDAPTSVTFGATGYAQTVTQLAAPQSFSLALWFKTSTDGSLGQFSTGQAAGTGTADRALWLNTSGRLVFYLNPGSAYELSSPSGTSYSDGKWHHIVVTAAPDTSTAGTVLMYVDGSLVAGATDDETITSSNVGATSSGWWQLGYSSGLSQSSPPSKAYLNGSMADVAYTTSVLSASQISTLYGETTEQAYVLQMSTDGASSLWAMQDSAADVYTGTLADVGSSVPCSYLAVTVATSSQCLYPAQSGSCPTSPTTWLTSTPLFYIPLALPALTLTTYESSSLPSAASGLHITVPWVFQTTGGGFLAQVAHNAGYVQL